MDHASHAATADAVLAHDDERVPAFATWTSAERESFFEAVARHRRAAWRVTAVSTLVNLITAFVIAVLMSPIMYAAVALACDLLNLAVPTPNIVASIMSALDPVFEKPETLSAGRWVELAVRAAVPGLAWMVLVFFTLRRTLGAAPAFGPGDTAREPNGIVLAEQRMANVIGEMAIAAGLPAPRVLILDSPAACATVCGRDEASATILVSQGLLARLDRDQLQGVAGHLVGSIANGDMPIGTRVATTLGVFAFVSRLASSFSDGRALRFLGDVTIAVLRPSGAAAARVLGQLEEPFAPDAEADAAERLRAKAGKSDKRNEWRKLLWIPFAGPVVITGFFGGLIDMFVLAPLLSLAWRQRKYMADATSVRLTRNPDALASALETLPAQRALSPWGSHLAVTAPSGGRGAFPGSSVVPPFPSLSRRLRALAKMGAHLRREPSRIPVRFLLIATPLFAIVGVLICVAVVLLAWLSVALSMLFLGLPFGVVHMLLRWLGH